MRLTQSEFTQNRSVPGPPDFGIGPRPPNPYLGRYGALAKRGFRETIWVVHRRQNVPHIPGRTRLPCAEYLMGGEGKMMYQAKIPEKVAP